MPRLDMQPVGLVPYCWPKATADPWRLGNTSRHEREQTLSKRLISLLGSAAVAVALAAGTAWGEDAPPDGQIAEVPLASTEAGVTFVPDELVVRTWGGGYQTRGIDAQSLSAVQQAAENIENQ